MAINKKVKRKTALPGFVEKPENDLHLNKCKGKLVKIEVNMGANLLCAKDEALKKNNRFINAIDCSDIYTEKIIYLSMLKIQRGDFNGKLDGEGTLDVELSVQEIKDFWDYPSDNIYSKLKNISSLMTGSFIGVIDDESKRFRFISLMDSAEYGNGVFLIKFGQSMKQYMTEFKNGFTLIPPFIVRALKTQYSFLLYQQIRMRCYYEYKDDNGYSFSIGVSKLKVILGLIDMGEKKVKKLISEGKDTDEHFDRILEISTKRKYNTWKDFKLKCLNPSVQEINEKSDINVRYEEIRTGKGGKTTSVRFYMSFKNGTTEKEALPAQISREDEEKIATVRDIAGEDLTDAQCMSIIDTANGSIEKVKAAVDVATKQGNIKNKTAFIKAAIKNNYRTRKQEKKSGNSFHNFKEHEYDFGDIEAVLLKHPKEGNKD